MEVTRTIRYKGSYQEALVLQHMLEGEGVHVQLRRGGRWRLERAQRRVQEWEVLMERAALLERHDREERQLLRRLGKEPRESHDQPVRELSELDQRHDRERKAMGIPSKGSDAGPEPLVSLRQMLASDLGQVGISLRSTGAAAAIAKTMQWFREAAPDCEVEIQGEPHTANDDGPSTPEQPLHCHPSKTERGLVTDLTDAPSRDGGSAGEEDQGEAWLWR
jgi:hypothetical protein